MSVSPTWHGYTWLCRVVRQRSLAGLSLRAQVCSSCAPNPCTRSQKCVLGLGELRPVAAAPFTCSCTSASPVLTRGRCKGSNNSRSSAHISSTLRMGLELLSNTRKYSNSSRSFLNSCLRVSLRADFCFFIGDGLPRVWRAAEPILRAPDDTRIPENRHGLSV